MKEIYRVQMPGNGDFDFTVGKEHREYGKVLSIKEGHEAIVYEGSSPSQYSAVIVITFEKQEIVLQCNCPLLVIYRKEQDLPKPVRCPEHLPMPEDYQDLPF